MREVTTPWPISEIMVTPEPTGRLRLSDDIQQTLSSIFAYDGETRRPLRCGKKGSLFVVSPTVQAIFTVIADQVSYTWAGDDIETSEVLLRAWTENAGYAYIGVDGLAQAHFSWRLDGGESISFSLDNLQRLNITITNNGDKVDLLYTR